MNRTIICFFFGGCFLIICSQVSAQQKLEFNYTQNHIDRSVGLRWQSIIESHMLTGGIKYHLWWPVTDNQNYKYKHRGDPECFANYFGLSFGYGYKLPLNIHSGANIYLFYDCQLSILSLIQSDYRYAGVVYDSLARQNYNLFSEVKGRLPQRLIVENNLGIMATFKLAGRFGLMNQAGIGLMAADNKEEMEGKMPDLEFIQLFYRVGITYEFRKKSSSE